MHAMRERTRRIFKVKGVDIECDFDTDALHIQNNQNLQTLLDRSTLSALDVAIECKKIFRQINGRDFDVHDRSVAIEILGHVYPGRVAQAIADTFPEYKHLLQGFVERTVVIDIGESFSNDGNRPLWDTLKVTFFTVVHILD